MKKQISSRRQALREGNKDGMCMSSGCYISDAGAKIARSAVLSALIWPVSVRWRVPYRYAFIKAAEAAACIRESQQARGSRYGVA